MTDTKFPVLKIVKVLDRTTLVLSGKGLDEIREGEPLVVLGLGPTLDEVGGAPLVVVKASVVVTANAGDYVVASPPGTEVEEPATNFSAMLYGMKQTRTVVRREPLTVTESELSGNPASRAVAIGDPVIRRADYKAFVQALKTASTKS